MTKQSTERCIFIVLLLYFMTLAITDSLFKASFAAKLLLVTVLLEGK